MQFAIKMVVTFGQKEKDNDWERAQRRLASGNFYFLTSIVVQIHVYSVIIHQLITYNLCMQK